MCLRNRHILSLVLGDCLLWAWKKGQLLLTPPKPQAYSVWSRPDSKELFTGCSDLNTDNNKAVA